MVVAKTQLSLLHIRSLPCSLLWLLGSGAWNMLIIWGRIARCFKKWKLPPKSSSHVLRVASGCICSRSLQHGYRLSSFSPPPDGWIHPPSESPMHKSLRRACVLTRMSIICWIVGVQFALISKIKRDLSHSHTSDVTPTKFISVVSFLSALSSKAILRRILLKSTFM